MRLKVPSDGFRRSRRRVRVVGGRAGAFKVRLLIAAVIAIVALVGYFGTNSQNPITGQNQRVGIDPA